MAVRASAIAGFVLKSADPARLARFYVEALGFVVERQAGKCIRLRLGASRVEIEAANGRPYSDNIPGFSTLFQHFALATADISAAFNRLLQMRAALELGSAGVLAGILDKSRPKAGIPETAFARWLAITQGEPVRLPASSGGVTAFKFRDPEGHPVELIQFPGDPSGPRIDHTAISVADRSRSLAFYEALGLAVSGGSLNQGPTQAALDGLEQPVVDIVALAPPRAGPHLELLAYRAPPSRADPPPGREDIAATRIMLTCTDEPPSPEPFRDPDGHWLQWQRRPDAR